MLGCPGKGPWKGIALDTCKDADMNHSATPLKSGSGLIPAENKPHPPALHRAGPGSIEPSPKVQAPYAGQV